MKYGDEEHIPVHSDKGKAMLAHAMSKEHCVIEFKEQDDGTMTVADITEHVEQLEKMVD